MKIDARTGLPMVDSSALSSSARSQLANKRVGYTFEHYQDFLPNRKSGVYGARMRSLYLRTIINLTSGDNMVPMGYVKKVRGFARESDGALPVDCTVKQDNPRETGAGLVAHDSAIKRSEESSLRLGSRNAEQSLTVALNPVPITPGDNYILSGYLRGENLSEPVTKETGIVVFFNQGPAGDFTTRFKLGTHRVSLFGMFDWECFGIPFTAEPDANQLRIAVQSRKMEGVLWIDDTKLVAQL